MTNGVRCGDGAVVVWSISVWRTFFAFDEVVLLGGQVEGLGVDPTPLKLGLFLFQEIGLGRVEVHPCAHASPHRTARTVAHVRKVKSLREADLCVAQWATDRCSQRIFDRRS